jgi:hypothetical protein
MPRLEQQVLDYMAGKVDLKTLPDDKKWCIYFGYRHEEWAASLIKELCRKEDGIMKAEKTVTKVSRDYRKFARNMAIMKNSMDRASDIYNAREEEKLEIARKMKEMGDPIEKIQIITGLTAEIIKSL